MKLFVFVFLILINSTAFSKVTQILGPYPAMINDIVFMDDLEQVGFVATSNGLYKTIDGGNEWIAISNTLPAQPPIASINANTRPVEKIATKDGNLIYALYSGNREGKPLFVTTNGGRTWSQVEYPKSGSANYIELTDDNELLLNTEYCLYRKNSVSSPFTELSCPGSKTMKYVNSHLIYASPSHKSPLENFKKSIDNGVTWIPLSGFGRSLGSGWPKIDATNNTLYVLKDDSVGQTFAKSSDFGLTWTIIKEDPKYLERITAIAHDNIDNEYVALNDERLYKVTDNVLTFEDMVLSGPKSPIIGKKIRKLQVNSIHPGRNFLIGTNIGLYEKQNHKYKVYFTVNGAFIEAIYKGEKSNTIFVVQNKNPSRLNGTPFQIVFRSKDDGINWEPLNFGGNVNVQHIYVSNQNVIYALSSTQDHTMLFRSLDDGDSWENPRDIQGFPRSCRTDSFKITTKKIYCSFKNSLFYTSLNDEMDIVHEVNFNNQEALFSFKYGDENEIAALTHEKIYLSRNGGESWDLQGTFSLPSSSGINSSSGNFIYVDETNFLFLVDNRVYVFKNDRIKHFILERTQALSPGAYDPKSHAPIHVTRKSSDEYYLSFHSSLYKTTDAGKTWTKLILPMALEQVIFNYFKTDGDNVYFITHGDNLYDTGLFKGRISVNYLQ
jgi:photosystem II stability/assembly factor-like uncharacterized protein